MNTLEVIMLAKLLVELLALIGSSAEHIQQIADEVNSHDPTGTKIANIAKSAAVIAATATESIEAAKSVETKTNG